MGYCCRVAEDVQGSLIRNLVMMSVSDLLICVSIINLRIGCCYIYDEIDQLIDARRATAVTTHVMASSITVLRRERRPSITAFTRYF